MSVRWQYLRVAAVLAVAVATIVLLLASYSERELWRVAHNDGSVAVLSGQQRWFGLTGIHLIQQQRDRTGRLLQRRIAGHADTWKNAEKKANVLHRQAYACDSPLYFKEIIRPVVAGIAQAADLVAYEAVPHRDWPQPLVIREAIGHSPLTLRDYLFFKTPVPLEREDASRLLRLFSAAGTFGPYHPYKPRGKFRPDWCLLWKGHVSECRAVLCFQTGEVRFYSPQSEIWSDLNEASLQELVEILEPYRAE